MLRFLLYTLILASYLPAQEKTTMPHGDDFKLDCELCHTTDSWRVNLKKVEFDHNSTGFPLIGRHAGTECRTCHQSLVFEHTPVACADCHTDVHKSEFGMRCENCHTPKNWDNRRDMFEVHSETDFPLLGVHALLDCQSCHTDEQGREFANTPVECRSCHVQDFMQTLNPSHKKAGFDMNCQNCHLSNAASWKQAVYQHTSAFPLNGGHARLECVDCHSSTFQGTTVDCYACHQQDYAATTNPNHKQFGFPTNCETCHNADNWQRAAFDHLAESGFALNGAHQTILCTDCHVNNQVNGLPRDCFGCHEDAFRAVQSPDHVSGGFSHNCLDCHNESRWSPADFDHNNTAFPLTGAHLSLQCESCHINGQYQNLPSDCWSCHEANFTGTTDPNHVQNNFSHDCTQCHNTSAWTPAQFDHANTDFPLTGAHTSLNCVECHSQGYTNTPTECVACHQSSYNNTTDPNHQAAQFPTTCEDCHNTTTWKPADWDHDGQYFPIYSGKHKGEWDVCADCHVNTANYAQFECINCHEHNRTKMDDKHKDVSGYSYDSQACYNCHPNGKEDD